MSEPNMPEPPAEELSRDEILTALFANLVLQQANLAMMFLGKVPHPQTGQETLDLEAAQMFIDNLEMLEQKTKGNLNTDEQKLLKQSLMTARLAFVEAADKAPAPAATPSAPAPAATSQPPSQQSSPAPNPPVAETAATEPDAEARRKYVKKY